LDISMARTRILGALGIDADDSAATDAHEPIERLPLPTLDERASVYLRAVHGDRDFTSAEHANARELMLEAMAADIAARDTWARDAWARDAWARDAWASDVAASDVATRSDSHSPNAVLQDLEPITVPGLVGDQDIEQSDDEPQNTVPIFSERSPAFSQHQQRSFFSEGRMLYGIAAVSSAAIFAAALGYWAGTLSQTVNPGQFPPGHPSPASRSVGADAVRLRSPRRGRSAARARFRTQRRTSGS
jgi:hypothetical protein